MASERNKLPELVNYITSLGINVNIGKNKARGNKGIFCKKNSEYRIDISKNIDSESMFSTLLHEFAHYIHYQYDNSLTSLDFVFKELSELEQEELISITVQNVPRDFASSLYTSKQHYTEENKILINCIKNAYPDFKVSEAFKPIERNLKLPVKYLLKYDKIQFLTNIYSVDTLEDDFTYLSNEQVSYIRLKSNQRKLARINSKINRLNKYYNQPSELWARFFELYFTKKNVVREFAPMLTQKFQALIAQKKIAEISMINRILNKDA